jgi:hypothetical protein
MLCLFQEQVDHQQVTEPMTSVAIDDPTDDWGQTESSQNDWSQQSESQTDWSQQTETQADWSSSPANQNDCKYSDIVRYSVGSTVKLLFKVYFDTKLRKSLTGGNLGSLRLNIE